MAYSLETSSVKTIVPGAEVSGFCDVVARQKINELSGEVPQLSAGEGIDISTVDGKTVITNNISAGSNISLVYDIETNTYRIDGQAGVDPASAVFSESARMPTLGLSYTSGVKISGGDETLYHKTIASFNTYISAVSLNGPYVTYLTGDSDVPTDLHPVTSEHWNNIITATKEVSDNAWNWNRTFNTVTANSASWSNAGHTYTGVAPIQVNNTTDEISITGESLSAGPGIDMFSSGGYVVISSNGGSVEGLYVPLSAKNCTIGDANSAGIGEWGATATNSFAQGDSNSAFAHSFVQGNGNSACWQSMAQGERNISFNQSMSQGTTNSAVEYSQALGDANTANKYSVAAGNRNFASRYSQALGYKLNISGGLASGGMAIGNCNKLSSNVSFVVGNGTSTANRSDAFVIYPDGSVSAAGKISANGVELGAGGSTFPITGTNGTTGFTANMDCSSMMLTTGASPAGGYVKQTTRGVQYEAYPATDVSASWYNIINATNNRSNCYCIRFTNDMTAASLEDYSAYDKVTVVHSNEYTPDCMLYWDGNTKVFPSGLYCELVKGTNDDNQTDWFFTTSGWINNVEWDWD